MLTKIKKNRGKREKTDYIRRSKARAQGSLRKKFLYTVDAPT